MSNVHLSTSGPGETIIPAENAEIIEALTKAAAETPERRRDAVADVVAKYPASLAVWAALGENARDVIEAYAAYRVGYHRGLDTLRKNGWRGSGFVRSKYESNQPFLQCLKGLADCALQIGEDDEAERCRIFLSQLDPR